MRTHRTTFGRAVCVLAVAVGSNFAAGPALAALNPPNEAQAEQVESRCEINGEEFNLTGKALDASIQDCVTQESPDLGYWESCRTGGRHKGLSGVALRSYVNYCLSRAP